MTRLGTVRASLTHAPVVITLIALLLASSAAAIDLTVHGLPYSFTSTQQLDLDFPYTIYWKVTTLKNETTNTNYTAVQFGVQATPPEYGWAAFGFNAQGMMTPSRALLVQKHDKDAPPALQEVHIDAHSKDGIHVQSKPIVRDLDVEYNDETVRFVFTIAINDEPTIQLNGKTGVIYTGGKMSADGILQHGSARSAMLDLSAGMVQSQPPSSAFASREALISLHAISMTLAWFVLVPLGIMFGAPSLRKKLFPKDVHSNPKHVSAHRLTTVFAVLLTIVGVFIGYYFIGTRSHPLHFWMGTTVTALVALQAMLGITRSMAKPGTKGGNASWLTRNRHAITFIHRWSGRGLWAIAVGNIFIGMFVAGLSNVYIGLAAVATFVGFLFMIMGSMRHG